LSFVLEARNLVAGYRGAAVVRDLSLHVAGGEVVALLGPNGAGKTTSLMTMAGALPAISGQVLLDGQQTSDSPSRRARAGMACVTEARSVFMQMSTIDNLKVSRCDVAQALDLFPELRPRLRVKVGLLSGGEQQMLALARVLTRAPKVLMADELSLGLAPLIVTRLLRAVRDAADQGVGVLLVEQHVSKALEVADRAYVMSGGRLQLNGTADEVRSRMKEIEASYMSGLLDGAAAGQPEADLRADGIADD
jgi:branched-chain amino acid transport system ATP-binding protein